MAHFFCPSCFCYPLAVVFSNASSLGIPFQMAGKEKMYTKASSTRIWIFLKMHLFYPYKKYPRPHEERFRKFPRPHEDAAAFKLLCSNFDKRKQTIKMPLRDPQKSVRMVWYVVNRCCDVSVLEKLRFHPSTRQHEKGALKKIHSGEWFRKASFFVTENAFSLWSVIQLFRNHGINTNK